MTGAHSIPKLPTGQEAGGGPLPSRSRSCSTMCERGGARSPLGTVIGFAAPARLGVTMRRPAPSTEADEATTAGRRKVDVATCAGSTIVTRNRGTGAVKRKEKPRARRGPVGAEMAAEPGRERSAVARQSPPPSLRRKRAAEPPVFEGPPWFPAKTAAGLAERAEGVSVLQPS